MAYATYDLDGIIAKLETALQSGAAEVTFEGRRIVYRSPSEIYSAIAYFRSLYDNATDASTPRAKTRMLFMHGGNGIGF